MTHDHNGVYSTTQVLSYDPSKYVATLISLDVTSLIMIIFLSVSAMRAYRFMASKDRVLLFHFIFLELSLLCKTFRLLLATLYYSNPDNFSHFWTTVFIFIENLGFLFFFIACSLNLFKWVLVLNRIEYYGDQQSLEQFNDLKRVQLGIFIVTISIISFIELVMISIDASIQKDEDAQVIDLILNFSYSVIGIFLSVLFVVTGTILLKRLNHHFEDLYEDKKSSVITQLLQPFTQQIRLSIGIICFSLILISLRFVIQEIFIDYFVELKVQSLINNSWDFAIYEFFAVFIFEFAPILASIILIWISVKRNWNDLYENPLGNEKHPASALRLNRSVIDQTQAYGENESMFSSHSNVLQRMEDRQEITIFQHRSHYMSAEFAFDQNQRFLLDYKQCGKSSVEEHKENGSSSLQSDSQSEELIKGTHTRAMKSKRSYFKNTVESQ